MGFMDSMKNTRLGPWGPWKFTAPMDLLRGNKEHPMREANEYFNQIPDILKQNFNPYIKRGKRAGNMLEGEYGELLGDPGGKLNEIGGSFQQSPGFDFALKKALSGANSSMAAGGMSGSPMHEQNNMETATNLANQDYNNWIKNALGLYGEGLHGEQGMYDIGARAGIGMGEDLASMKAQQGRMAYENAAGKNQKSGMDMNNMLQAAGMLMAFL